MPGLLAADIVRDVSLKHVPHQPVLALGRRGAALAASVLGIDRAGLGWSPRHNVVTPLFLEHTLCVNDVRLAFHAAARSTAGQAVVEWRNDREIVDRVPDARRPGVWLPVRPDGYLLYQTPAGRMHAFIEADLGTVTNRRWGVRVQAYVSYRLSGAFHSRYGAPGFRLLTVTTTQRRLANLVRTTEKAGGRSLFWFTTWDEITAHSPLSAIWRVAGATAERRPSGSSGNRGSPARGPPGA